MSQSGVMDRAQERPSCCRAKEVAMMRPGEVQQRLAQDAGAVLIDVRTPGEYAQVHVPQAKLMPLPDLDVEAVRRMAHDGDGEGRPVYVICHSGARAKRACEQLMEAGLTNVVCVEGGTKAWADAGLPVERSEAGAMSLERQVRIIVGAMVLAGTLLSVFVHPAFVWLAAFFGAGLLWAGLSDTCMLAMLLARMPWNRGSSATA